jgi:RNA polymerase sigma factor (sigma-70 family)
LKTKKSQTAETSTTCKSVSTISEDELLALSKSEPNEMDLEDIEEEYFDADEDNQEISSFQNLNHSILNYPFYKEKLDNAKMLSLDELKDTIQRIQEQRKKHDEAFLNLLTLVFALTPDQEKRMRELHHVVPYCFDLDLYPFLKYESRYVNSDKLNDERQEAMDFFSQLAAEQKSPSDKKNILAIYELMKEVIQFPSSRKLNGHFIKLSKLSQKNLQNDQKLQRVHDEWQNLFKAKDELKSIEEILCYSNLRLVISVARKYLGRGLGLSDLIQLGNIGLQTAVRRYLPDYKGRFGKAKFGSYAVWWIKQHILRGLHNQAKDIRNPVHIQDMYSRIAKTLHYFRSVYPDVSRDTIWKMAADDCKITMKKMAMIMGSCQHVLSLNAPINDTDKTSIEDLIGDNIIPNPEQQTVKNNLGEVIQKILKGLTPKELTVIRKRFGINEDADHTLQEVGDEFDLTRERIRQIEFKAFKKMRHPKHLKILRPFLN